MEFEYEIPAEDARALLEQFFTTALIRKTRYRLEFEGHTWEIDEFHDQNTGLTVAEVELESPDGPIRLPPWVGAEISRDLRYTNAALFKHPWSQWTEAEKKAFLGPQND
jgi:CYTH domain-containing protein